MGKSREHQAIVFDFDGTIASYKAREEHRNVDWDKYIALSHTDVPNIPVVELIHRFRNDFSIIIVTARAESSRAETEEWLHKYDIYYDDMHMRANSIMDIDRDGDIKADILKDKVIPYYDILFCIDDRECCARAFRKLGLTVFQCGDGY